ncbi:hypothetical protein [Nocardiopsis ganjiahuensis]|nr:hypothetical protein [Nocardiopsis ganjiahuensis]
MSSPASPPASEFDAAPLGRGGRRAVARPGATASRSAAESHADS